ncbi:hypothetical protein T09_1799 [Trichinella sp. T9]|nr:hypothetical protein T09_1799 [Trichinella sp. T9]
MEHIQYIPHILLNTPKPTSVYRYILIYTPCLHTPETFYSNSLSQDLSQLSLAHQNKS